MKKSVIFLCLTFPPQNTPSDWRGKSCGGHRGSRQSTPCPVACSRLGLHAPQPWEHQGGSAGGWGGSHGFHEAVAAFELLRKDPIWWRHGEGLVLASRVGRLPSVSTPEGRVFTVSALSILWSKHCPVSSWTCCSRPVTRCSVIQMPFSISSIPFLYPDPPSRKYTPKWQKPKLLQLPISKLPT